MPELTLEAVQRRLALQQQRAARRPSGRRGVDGRTGAVVHTAAPDYLADARLATVPLDALRHFVAAEYHRAYAPTVADLCAMQAATTTLVACVLFAEAHAIGLEPCLLYTSDAADE